MPVLHHYRNGDGAYVKAWIRGAVCTFQLTAEGRERLEVAGLGDEDRFPQSLLNDLLREREAFTRSGDRPTPAGSHEAEQFMFDFARDQAAADQLPRCEVNGGIDDLHLVVSGAGCVDGDGAKSGGSTRLLGREARAASAESVVLSVPVAILDLAALERLVRAGEVDGGSPAVADLRAWFRRERAAEWERFTAPKPRHQAGLGLDVGDRLL